MKKVLSIVVVLAMLMAFAACGSQTTEPSTEESGASSQTAEVSASESEDSAPIELEFWVVGTEEDMHYKCLPAAIDQFNAQNEEVHISVVVGGAVEEYTKKITLMAETDSLPDFFEAGDALCEGFGDAGVMTEIGTSMKADEEWSSYQYATGAYDNQLSYQSGKIYGIPLVADAQGFFYNKAILAQYGLDVPKTWEEFVNVVETLRANGVTPIAHGTTDIWSIWGYYSLFARYGINEVGASIKNGETTFSDTMVPAFEKIKELADMGAYPEGTTSMSYSQALEMFKNGEAAIFGSGAWDAGGISAAGIDAAFNWGPTFSDSTYDQKVALKTVSWSLYTGSSLQETPEKLDAAMRFLKYMCSPEVQVLLIENGFSFPVYSTGDTVPEIDPLSLSIFEAIGDDNAPIVEAYNYVDTTLQDTFWNAVSSVINGSITPEEACQQLDDFLALM